MKDKMLYQRRIKRMSRKRVYVLNNWHKVQETKKICKINLRIKKEKRLDEILVD